MIILAYFFGFLAFVLVAILGVSFSRGQRNRYSILRRLDGKQLRFFLFAVFFAALSYGASAIKDTWQSEPVIVIHVGTEEVLKATESGFDREVKKEAGEKRQIAIRYFKAAEADFDQGLYRDAAKNYRKSIDAIPTMSAYLNLGLCLRIVSDHDPAEEAFAAGLRLSQERKDSVYHGVFLARLGETSCEQGQFDEGIASLEAALDLFERIGHREGRMTALIGLACANAKRGNLGGATGAATEALQIAKELGSLGGQGSALNNMALVLYRKGELDGALRLFKESLVQLRQIGDISGEVRVLNNMATIYRELGDLEAAVKHHVRATKMYEKTGDLKGQASQASALNGIGIEYRSKGELKKALEAHKAALKVYRDIGNALGEANTLGSIGVDYAFMEKQTLALENLRAAREMFLRMGAHTRNLAMIEAAIRDLCQKADEE